MAKHEFGIMPIDPVKGERFDKYEPEKYNCISVDDEYIERLITSFQSPCFSHTLDNPTSYLEYAGITLIPPETSKIFADKIIDISELSELRGLLQKAYSQNKFIIHFGI